MCMCPHVCNYLNNTQEKRRKKEVLVPILISYRIINKKWVQIPTAASGFSVCSLYVLSASAWILSGSSGFLLQTKDMHLWLRGTGNFKLNPNKRECDWLFVHVSTHV